MIITALPAAAIAVGELISLGCVDIMAAKSGKTWFHHKGLAGLLAGERKAVPKNGFVSIATFATGLLRGSLYYPWIIGVGTSFVANWATLIYQEQKCTLPGNGHLSFGLQSIFLGAGNTGTVQINGIGGKQCCSIGGNKVAIPMGCHGDITYSCDWRPFNNLPTNQGVVRTWIQDDTGKRFSESTTGPPAAGLSESTAGGLSFTPGLLDVGHEYQIMFEVQSGLMGCVAGTVSVSAYGRKMSLIPAGCVPKPAHYPWEPEPYVPPKEPPKPRLPRASIPKLPRLKPKQHFPPRPKKKKRPKNKKPKK